MTGGKEWDMGPETELAQNLHATKYRGRGESFKEAMNRIAGGLTEGDDQFYPFRDVILEQRFLPAGRVQAAIGSTKTVTPYNCYVSGTIEDSFVDGKNSIMAMATEAAATMRMGGGIGYDFSTLRPSGEMIRKLQSASSGPVSFMEIFDAVCKCVASSGHRRGAQMGVMRVDHPDIEEFVDAKRQPGRLEGFNISVGITDEFMRALIKDKPFTLRFEGREYQTIKPSALWDKIMRSNYDWAEPGVLFLDRINNMNNLWYTEEIAATNPCGEQPLPPYGACLLGSFNLVKYVYGEDGYFNFTLFDEDIKRVVRAMDRVVDVATYPLPEQEKEAKAKRRMGLGVTGVANAIEKMGYSYGSEAFCHVLDEILENLKCNAYWASVELAKERGPFPLFDAQKYGSGKFIKTLPDSLQAAIYEHGIRNSHLISIAPTGTISLCADNVSSGIEPVFGYKTSRKINMPDGERVFECEDYGKRVWGVAGRTIADVTVEEHLNVLKTAIVHVDSAVSKTCNFPKDVPYNDFKETYIDAWRGGAKGLTIYRYGCKREGIIEVVDDDEETRPAAACSWDSETGIRDCGE